MLSLVGRIVGGPPFLTRSGAQSTSVGFGDGGPPSRGFGATGEIPDSRKAARLTT